MRAKNRSGKRESQPRAGAGFRVFQGSACGNRKKLLAGYGIALLGLHELTIILQLIGFFYASVLHGHVKRKNYQVTTWFIRQLTALLKSSGLDLLHFQMPHEGSAKLPRFTRSMPSFSFAAYERPLLNLVNETFSLNLMEPSYELKCQNLPGSLNRVYNGNFWQIKRWNTCSFCSWACRSLSCITFDVFCSCHSIIHQNFPSCSVLEYGKNIWAKEVDKLTWILFF